MKWFRKRFIVRLTSAQTEETQKMTKMTTKYFIIARIFLIFVIRAGKS